jgi:hypothetical protein
MAAQDVVAAPLRNSRACAKSAGGAASKRRASPLDGWRKPTFSACSACRPMPRPGVPHSRVGDQWMAARRQVNADLVRSAGVQAAFQPASSHPHGRQRTSVRPGRPEPRPPSGCAMPGHVRWGHRSGTRRAEPTPCTIARYSRCTSRAAISRDSACHRWAGLADDHQAGRVLVEPVHDAGAWQRGGRGIAVEQPVQQSCRSSCRGRMNDEAGGLVSAPGRRRPHGPRRARSARGGTPGSPAVGTSSTSSR